MPRVTRKLSPCCESWCRSVYRQYLQTLSVRGMADHLGVAYDTIAKVIAGRSTRALTDAQELWILDNQRRRAVSFSIEDMARMFHVSRGTIALAVYPERRAETLFSEKLRRVYGAKGKQQEVRA
jgi:plasmid maintenance system antidote protein VapI